MIIAYEYPTVLSSWPLTRSGKTKEKVHVYGVRHCLNSHVKGTHILFLAQFKGLFFFSFFFGPAPPAAAPGLRTRVFRILFVPWALVSPFSLLCWHVMRQLEIVCGAPYFGCRSQGTSVARTALSSKSTCLVRPTNAYSISSLQQMPWPAWVLESPRIGLSNC